MGRYTVSWVGPKNNFGSLTGPYTPVDNLALQGISPAHGESLVCQPSESSYQTHPGQVHFFTAFAPNGNVVIITGSQSNNPLSQTAVDSQVVLFDPSSGRFNSVNIPTRTTAGGQTDGQWRVIGSNGITGGQDCADVLVYRTPNAVDNPSDPSLWDNHILVMTFAVYSGWDLHNGEFPVFVLMAPSTPNDGGRGDPSGGRIRSWSITKTLTASQIAASNPTKASGIYTAKVGTGGNYTDAHSPGEMSQFPQSRHIVFGHYFSWEGGTSGSFSVVDVTKTGQELRATYKMPNCTGPGGAHATNSAYLWLAPREIECDPSSSLNDERFTVIYDGYPYANIGGTGSVPHLIQEFSYNASAGTITPKSGFVNVLQDDQPPIGGPLAALGPGGPSEITTHRYDSNGNVFVCTQTMASLQTNNPMAVFLKKSGERDIVTNCPPTSGWETRYNSTKLTPDFYVPATGRNSAVPYSHDLDSSRRNVLSVGLNGVLTVVNWDAGFPVSGNLIPSIDQLNSTGVSPPGTLPFISDFGSAQLSWFKFNGKWGVKMVSSYPNTMNAKTPSIGGLEVGRQYRVRAEFAAGVGMSPVRCDIKIDSFDASGNAIGVLEQIGTITQIDAAVVNNDGSMTGSTVVVETNFDCLDRTDHIVIQLFPKTSVAGQVHCAQNLSMVALPFKRRAVIDLGVNTLRNTATARPGAVIDQNANPIQIRKSCFDQANNKLYTPAGFLGVQILGPTSAPPSTPRQIAQYLICTDIGNLGATAPTDQGVIQSGMTGINMGSGYVPHNYSWSLVGPAAPACGFVVNIPISVYPYLFGYKGWDSEGGGVIGGCAAVSESEGNSYLFVRGLDNQIYFRKQYGASDGPWTALGGSWTCDPCAVVEPVAALGTTGYQIHVFAIGNDQQIWQCTRNVLGTWGGWVPRGGWITAGYRGANRGPAAACLGSGKLDVYVGAGNYNIYRLSLRNGVWAWDPGIIGYSDGRMSAVGIVASNTPTVYLTSTWSNGQTLLYGFPNGGFAGAYSSSLSGYTAGRASIVGWQPPNETLGSHLSVDVLAGGSDNQLYRTHYQTWNPAGYPYQTTGWSGFQKAGVNNSYGINPSPGAVYGFHNQKDKDGRPYMVWDAYANALGSTGVWRMSYLGQ